MLFVDLCSGAKGLGPLRSALCCARCCQPCTCPARAGLRMQPIKVSHSIQPKAPTNGLPGLAPQPPPGGRGGGDAGYSNRTALPVRPDLPAMGRSPNSPGSGSGRGRRIFAPGESGYATGDGLPAAPRAENLAAHGAVGRRPSDAHQTADSAAAATSAASAAALEAQKANGMPAVRRVSKAKTIGISSMEAEANMAVHRNPRRVSTVALPTAPATDSSSTRGNASAAVGSASAPSPSGAVPVVHGIVQPQTAGTGDEMSSRPDSSVDVSKVMVPKHVAGIRGQVLVSRRLEEEPGDAIPMVRNQMRRESLVEPGNTIRRPAFM